ncbi:MAG: response regulator [Nitrospirae bacterium]|nr:response regulator [Nitrospirota bacterium]
MGDIELLKQITILFVEDDFIVRETTAQFLRRRCKEVYVAENGKIGFQLYERHSPDIVVTDIEMPVMDGLEMINQILAINPAQPIVITTGYDDERHKDSRVCIHLIKPIVDKMLVGAIIKFAQKT